MPPRWSRRISATPRITSGSVAGDIATVGITAFAGEQLGDIVFVELPDVGRVLAQHETFGVVESVKAVSDLFSPVGGEVVETNGDLTGKPELVNGAPYEAGWMIRIRISAPGELDELLDGPAYDALVAAG